MTQPIALASNSEHGAKQSKHGHFFNLLQPVSHTDPGPISVDAGDLQNLILRTTSRLPESWQQAATTACSYKRLVEKYERMLLASSRVSLAHNAPHRACCNVSQSEDLLLFPQQTTTADMKDTPTQSGRPRLSAPSLSTCSAQRF